MIGLISPKKHGDKRYVFVARWESTKAKGRFEWFRFCSISDETRVDTDLDNMGGPYGFATWETKSKIEFMPDDALYFRGKKFNVVSVNEVTDDIPERENAYAWFNTNGAVIKRILVRKAGA